MIICANCQHENMIGAAFCTECGAMLLSTESLITHRMQTDGQPTPVAVAPGALPKPSAQSDNWITLHLLESGEVLPLADRNEFTLGRASEGQPVMPDIDLGPYQAFTHGVSRLHAVIRRGVHDVLLSDLESANGTFINGERLPSDEERPLAHGDVISLGSLKLQVLLKKQ
jgi:hypothetical protein